MSDPSHKSMQLSVVTPEQTVLESAADAVLVTLVDGELGILPNHSPMIGRLGYGAMQVRTGQNVSRYYVDGGFVQVEGNRVSVLTNRAMPVAEIDAAAAQEQLAAAQARTAASAEEAAIRDRLVAQARGQVRAASRGTS